MSDRRPFPLPGAREQYGPDERVEVVHIDLALRPDLARKRLEGICTTTVRARAFEVRTLALDAVDLDIFAVTGPGEAPLRFRARGQSLAVELTAPLGRGDELTFAVRYAVEQPRRGLYFVDRPVAHAWTQGQDSDARAWFPCIDYPAAKQTTSATVVVPTGLFALANGALVERREDGGETTYRYEQSVPHATYLMTLVVGPFHEVRQEHPRVPIFFYTLPGREDDGRRAFGNTPAMLDVFERVLGVPYPYARYSQIAVADFIFGGMENTSATTQTDRVLHDERAHLDFSADYLVSHELAHQWFGDLVTCRDWAHAWLNEGFATYCEALWLEAHKGWDEYAYDLHTVAARYFEEDEERYRRSIVCNVFRDPIELFDRHLYEKGATVLHLLRGELGWEEMRRCLRRYLTENAQHNVETIDLVRAIERETGRNLRRFFAQWVERPGHPELSVTYRWDAERSAAELTVAQRQPVDDAHPAYAFSLEAGFLAALPERLLTNFGEGPLPDETRVRLDVERAPQTFVIPLANEPALVRIDPAAYVLAEIRWELGPDVHAASLRRDPSPRARIRAARALAKDGGRVARAALEDALAQEPFWGVAAEVAAALGETRAPFARVALLRAVSHPHPKVRRAVVEALGGWRDPEVAAALLALRDDPSYFVAAASLHALGKTRDERAFEALSAALGTPSWNETIAAGAARGLAELADARALPLLVASIASTRPEPLRRAAAGALARLATLVDGLRAEVVDAVERLLDDPAYLVRAAAYSAAEILGDARLLGALDRLAGSETDGRLRRDAAEAAQRIREARSAPAGIAALRDELELLRAETRALRERLDERDRA